MAGLPPLTTPRAQSQPCMPRSFTAFTATTVPGVTPSRLARGWATVRVALNGSLSGPHAREARPTPALILTSELRTGRLELGRLRGDQVRDPIP
jgi:hypothetical protein